MSENGLSIPNVRIPEEATWMLSRDKQVSVPGIRDTRLEVQIPGSDNATEKLEEFCHGFLPYDFIGTPRIQLSLF